MADKKENFICGEILDFDDSVLPREGINYVYINDYSETLINYLEDGDLTNE